MITRIFSSKIHSITGAAILVGATSLMSKIIGLIRDRLLAHEYGAGTIMDAYYAAFKIPDFVYNLLIIGALSAGFIPVFIEAMQKDKKESWNIVNGVVNTLGLSLIIVSIIALWQTPRLVGWLVPGFTGEKLALTIQLSRVMFFSPLILGLSSIFGSVLQSYKAFAIYSMTPIMYNLGIIIGITILVPFFGTIGLSYGVILGAVLHLAIQLPLVVKYGYRYRPNFHWKNKSVRKIGHLMIPRMLGMATKQIDIIVITILASTAGTGSLSVFSFADNLQSVPVSMVGIAFAIAIFPTLSELAGKSQITELRTQIARTARQIMWLIIPLAITILLLRAQIVRVVLGTGQFDWKDTILTAQCLAFFSISIFAQSLTPMLARSFYALQNTWTPFVVSIISTLVNLGAGIWATPRYGIVGLVAGYSLSTVIQTAVLWMLLHRSIGSLKESTIVNLLAKVSIAVIGMGIVIQGFKYTLGNMLNINTFVGIFTQGIISGIAGILIYGFICHLLRVEEMEIFMESFKRKWFKLKSADVEIGSVEK